MDPFRTTIMKDAKGIKWIKADDVVRMLHFLAQQCPLDAAAFLNDNALRVHEQVAKSFEE